MFPPPSNHVKHSSTVVIYHVPIFPTSSGDRTVCEMDRVTLLLHFFAHSRHMPIHRCQMKDPQPVCLRKHMLVAPRQQLFIVLYCIPLFTVFSTSVFPFPCFVFFFSYIRQNELNSICGHRYLKLCLQLHSCNSRVSELVCLTGWHVKNACNFSTAVWKQTRELKVVYQVDTSCYRQSEQVNGYIL